MAERSEMKRRKGEPTIEDLQPKSILHPHVCCDEAQHAMSEFCTETEPQPEPDIEGLIRALIVASTRVPERLWYKIELTNCINALAAACRALQATLLAAGVPNRYGDKGLLAIGQELIRLRERAEEAETQVNFDKVIHAANKARIAALEKALAGAHAKGCIRLYCGDDTIKIPEQHDPRCLALRGGKIEPNRRELE